MIEKIIARPSMRARHEQSPLLREREQYLAHLAQQGTNHQQLQSVAAILLNVIRFMDLSELRSVDREEIRKAGELWAQDKEFHKVGEGRKSSAIKLTNVARGWFRFLGRLTIPTDPIGPFDDLLADFVHELRVRWGLAIVTVESYRYRASIFLEWLAERHDRFSSATLNDVDDFLDLKRAGGWKTGTIVCECQALRSFFGHAGMRGWCGPELASCIRSPRTPRYDGAPRGPSWGDVRRLIHFTSGSKKSEIRVHAIILLCSIYGLRSSEVAGLRLEDFDWRNETLTVKRAKHGRTQQYPIQYEVGEAILRYLRYVRPRCACHNLFVTLYPPYNQVVTATLRRTVAKYMKGSKIESAHHGPHAFRHACATQLLKKGSSLQEIADFLGHRDTRSVSIYAKYDSRSLRKVAAFSLGWVR